MDFFANFFEAISVISHSQANYNALLGTSSLLLTCIFITFILVRYCYSSGKVNKVKNLVGVGLSDKPRFRKRDKVMFYGRKMLRKVRAFSVQGKSVGERQRLKKRQMVIKFAKKFLRLRKDNQQPLQLQVREPPPAYLEPDIDNAETFLPPEVWYMYQSIRIFGHFDKPMFLDLCKQLEQRFIYAGHYLFRIGDPDDSIYVVQSGRLNIFLLEHDGMELPLKLVKEGDNVTSFLSFADILMGQPSVFKTVCARAEVDTVVLRLPMAAFLDVLHNSPEYLVRVMQIIMVRLHRVSFTALYQYLGLTTQLINPVSQYRRSHSGPSQSSNFSLMSPKVSPSKNKPRRSQSNVAVSSSYEEKCLGNVDVGSGVKCTECNKVIHPAAAASSLPTDSDIEKCPAESFTSHDEINKAINPFIINRSPHSTKSRKKSSNESSDYFSAHSMDECDYMQMAIGGIKSNLRLNDESVLQGRLEIKNVMSGTFLIEQESSREPSLIYCVTGSLIVVQKMIDKDKEMPLYTAYPGELVGGLAVISGEPSFFTIRAKQASVVAIISKENFYAILRENPKSIIYVADPIVRRLSNFVRQIDFALDWKHIDSGKAVYRQGERADCMYIVLSGRLRSVITLNDGKRELVGEYGRGDLIGVVELATQTLRSTSVIAVRDTELAIMPEGLLDTIKIKFPVVVTRLIHLLGHGILGSWKKGGSIEKVELRPTASNFSTVAVLAVTDDVPLTAFSLELYHSLSAIGPVIRLTSDYIRRTQGASCLDRSNEFRLSSWLGQQEDHHRIIIYQCDNELTPWTLRCIRQADVILIVALADQEPTVGTIEKQLETLAVRTQKELILLHKENSPRPQNSVTWLNIRSWCSSHHHICCSNRMFTKKSMAKLMEVYNVLFKTEPNIHSDFSRLARFLTGTSIGLVLGGGGARGCAHVGMIRAIMEAGIPIDMVGGVSIGSFMGALWCQEKDLTSFTRKAREWAFKMTSVWRQLIDLTYPVTAMFTGAGFNKVIREVFPDTQIEDLWLPYFAITTDITSSAMRVHTHGPLWRYVRASMSLSGYLPPLCDPTDGHLLLDGGYVNNLPGSLWRYVRASMSISGIVPPLCDPEDGHLLVDGAYVNNLPADVMRNMGVHQILAIDVGSQDETDLTNYGDQLSGWWLLWKRWNPWAKAVKVPNMPEIQTRLAYVSCVRQLEEVKHHNYCTYIRPPIDEFKTLQFGSFDKIQEVGLNHGRQLFETMRKEGSLPGRCQSPSKKEAYKPPWLNYTKTPSTYTDLAEIVCRINEPSKGSCLTSDYSDCDDVDDDNPQDYSSASEEDTQVISETQQVVQKI